MNAALAIIATTLALALSLGVAARRGRPMTLEQWTVGGRGFGTLFVFLLTAGEVYTTFTFLGGSGWAYGRGAPAFYILCYGTIAYITSYFLAPAIWRHATRLRLYSQGEFFGQRYGSPALDVVVSLVGVAAMIPYVVLQLRGLGIILGETSYGSLSTPVAVWISTAVLVVYVMVSGVHGSAWTSVVKDVLILAVVVALGTWLPLHLYGGFRPMFEALAAAKPGFLVLPATGQSVTWFVSTVLLTACGFYMWPHGFASLYTAKDERSFRTNAAIMPLYQLVMLFVMFIGFAAVLAVPGLEGADADLALLRLALQQFPPWLVGVVGAAGLLTALVPGSMLLMTAGTILARSVYARVDRRADVTRVARVARWMVPAVALVSVAVTLYGGTAIVPLLLAGYNVVTQLFPALLAALPARPLATKAGALAGILAGEAVVAAQAVSGATLSALFPNAPHLLTDLNIGVVALGANAVALVAVSALTGGRSTPTEPIG